MSKNLKDRVNSAYRNLSSRGRNNVVVKLTVEEAFALMHRAQSDLNRLRADMEDGGASASEIACSISEMGGSAEMKLRELFVKNRYCRGYAEQKVKCLHLLSEAKSKGVFDDA